jgi:hypothetical protein
MAKHLSFTAESELTSRYSGATTSATFSSVLPAVVFALSMQAAALVTAKLTTETKDRTAVKGAYSSPDANSYSSLRSEIAFNAEAAVENFITKVVENSRETPVDIARAINNRLFELL